MNTQAITRPHENERRVEVPSMLLGIAAGIVGTLLFAAFRRREFDHVVDSMRDFDDRRSEFVHEQGKRAHKAVTNASRATVRAVKGAESNAHGLIERLDPK